MTALLTQMRHRTWIIATAIVFAVGSRCFGIRRNERRRGAERCADPHPMPGTYEYTIPSVDHHWGAGS